MSREKDQLTNSEDAGYKTESGNHAAGGIANDTTQVNKAPNVGASRQSSAAGSSGGMDMTQQSIGGSGAQDGISGTPSGTQGGQSGQGIDQGGRNQQSAQGHSGGMPQHQGGIGIQQNVQLDPQERNRDQYGRQQTGATSGEVGDDTAPDPGNRQSGTSGGAGKQQSQRQQGMQGAPGEAGHDIDDLGNKQSGGGTTRGEREDQR